MLNEATRQFIREHRRADVRQLALQFKPADVAIDFQTAMTQLAGRQSIEHKIPSWYAQDEVWYPARLALEQCSSEATARYKASLLSGYSLADLTGGFGVDTAFMAPQFVQTQYVERQPGLAAIARHNFAVFGLNIQTHIADGVEFLQTLQPVDCLYLDPARRASSGRKTVRIEDGEPNVLSIQDQLLSKAGQVLIKFSPMLDVRSAREVLKNGYQIHIVSVENECKELLFWLRQGFSGEPAVVCVNISMHGIQSDAFTLPDEKAASLLYAAEVKNYLYEPNASILKGGFFKSVSLRYAVEKLHPDSHLYTSEKFIPDFPGRIFQVEAVSSFNKKELKNLLQNTRRSNLSIRNFPLTVEQLRKQLKISEGGDDYFFATTLKDGRHVLLKVISSVAKNFNII
ncbi:MAG: SAM-dependent methyltransferase [Dysgonamonadaceae bacterium]|jgi:hypothetical protein|nr:SAM-dependent methyltransferase [Dysgonamonadaceae bacterium]